MNIPHLEGYLDNAATTPVLPQVLDQTLPLLQQGFGNPSSLHRMGMEARVALARSREKLARLLGVPPKGVVFTSGGTESDNLALRGVFAAPHLKGDRLLISALEHAAVAETAQALATQGVRAQVIPITAEGVVDLPALARLLGPDVRMVSVMAVSNELGTQQPLEAIGKLLREQAPQAVFHVDAVQALAKVALPWKAAGVDLLSVSGHKVHGPKGSGALVMCRALPLVPLLTGGGQEQDLRSGTENVFGQAAFALAAELTQGLLREQQAERAAYYQGWLDYLAQFPRLKVFRSPAATPYVIRLSLPPVPGEVILHHLEAEGLMVSTGSACASNKPEPATALLAAGWSEAEALSSFRISFSLHNTLAGLEACQQAFGRAITKLMKY